MSTAVYAYAVVDAHRALPLAEGIGRGPLRLVAAGRVAAVAGPVEVGDFEGDALERNLARSGWLEEVVRAHEDVVEALAAEGSVLPMRFGSIFSDERGLRAMLEENAATLSGLLDRLRGRVELGVTVRKTRSGSDPDRPGPPGSGRDYLRRRQAELRAAGEASAAAGELAGRLHAALAEGAEEASLLEPRRSDPSVILTASYLVPVGEVDRFCERADALGRSHPCLIELTGPWPPYSFASIDVAGAHC
ncbi:MAG TPA: GvpL/GvpF family gas vesicle protein [Acidimicrobiales bacterium]|nr:GvpL/GvpF family gas vesicle protein [Acidimicrobiales bacterium]